MAMVNIAQHVAQKITEKSTEGVTQAAEGGVQGSTQANAADAQKFMHLMQQTQSGPASGVQPGQTAATSASGGQSKTIGERILQGIAKTAQSQEAGYQGAMSKVMDATKTGASPTDLLQAQVGLMKVETMQQAEGKAVSKVDQTVENLLKGG